MFTKAIERVCLKQSNGRIEHTDDALRLLLCYFSKCQWQICVRLIIVTHFCTFYGGSHAPRFAELMHPLLATEVFLSLVVSVNEFF